MFGKEIDDIRFNRCVVKIDSNHFKMCLESKNFNGTY